MSVNEKVKINRTTKDSHYILAVFSLVIGILSIPTSFILFGFILGTLGIVFGIWHWTRRTPGRWLSGLGIGFSIGGIIASGCMLWMYAWMFQTMQEKYLLTQESWNEWIGRPTPEIALTDLEGKSFTLSSLKGKRVIVDFWATWCAPCKKQLPHFIQLHHEQGEELVILGISQEALAVQQTFAQEHKIPFLLATATGLTEPYRNVVSIPTTFFIDEQGIIRHVSVGYHNLHDLQTAVTEHLNQEE